MLTNDGEHAPLAHSDRQQESPSKDSASGKPRMFSRRLIKIMTLMERFREEAERKGHFPFADALQECTLEISGGNMECPLGKLVVDESARTGVFMAFNAAATAAPRARSSAPADGRQVPADTSVMTVLEWQSKYKKLWELLGEEARLANDTECLEALEACTTLTEDHRCPVRALIAQNLWHAGKS